MNWRPTEGPRTPELDLGTTSGRATNDQIESQETPHRDRRAGHGSDKEAQTQDTAAEAAPKWLNLHRTGYSLTLALDAEATAANLGYDCSK